jgi:BirA family biotin operon repressor/biotin-[acetyl-CoA-carboxylase] ligase
LNGEKHSSIISTQSTLKERLDSIPLLQDRYYVLADAQTGGRGRGDHQWVSVSGNLHASILIRESPLQIPTWIPLWISVCTRRALVKFGVTSERLKLKWPNDLWLDEQFKTAGILCEKKGPAIIAGIGVNLIHAPLPGSAVIPFESSSPSAEAILNEIIFQLSLDSNIDSIRKEYDQHSVFKVGSEVTWNSNQLSHRGRVVGLGEYGELVLDTETGRVSLYSEEVSTSRLIVKDQST